MNAWTTALLLAIIKRTRAVGSHLAAALLMAMTVGLVAPAPVAQAAIITVDSTLDNVMAGNGACTLREAVNNANANSDTTAGDCTAGSGADDIYLPAGLYTLGTGMEDANASGDLDVLGGGGNLIISGDGPGATTISGPGYVVFVDRILDIDPGNSGNIIVTVQDLTMEEGHTGQGGGAIHNRSDSLILNNVVIRNCSATFGGGSSFNGNGGAIFNNGGAVTIRDSLIEENAARGVVVTTVGGGAIFNTGGQVEIFGTEFSFNRVQSIAGGGGGANGGAIFNENVGQVTVQNTLFRENLATDGGSGGVGAGGAIFNAAGARLDIQHSTLGANRADVIGGALVNIGKAQISQSLLIVNESSADGGAIHHSGGGLTIDQSSLVGNTTGGSGGAILNGSSLVMVNSTLSANNAEISGGAILNAATDATLINVTVTRNIADSNGDGSGDGGGLWNIGGNVLLRNALIAENVDNSSSATVYPDLSGSFTSDGHNLIGDGTGSSGLINGINGDQVGTSGSPIDPQLMLLAYDGNYTPAHGLLSSSPAINAGGNVGCPAVDQRGTSRPVGPQCDIGAVEAVHFVYLPLVVVD